MYHKRRYERSDEDKRTSRRHLKTKYEKSNKREQQDEPVINDLSEDALQSLSFKELDKIEADLVRELRNCENTSPNVKYTGNARDSHRERFFAETSLKAALDQNAYLTRLKSDTEKQHNLLRVYEDQVQQHSENMNELDENVQKQLQNSLSQVVKWDRYSEVESLLSEKKQMQSEIQVVEQELDIERKKFMDTSVVYIAEILRSKSRVGSLHIARVCKEILNMQRIMKEIEPSLNETGEDPSATYFGVKLEELFSSLQKRVSEAEKTFQAIEKRLGWTRFPTVLDAAVSDEEDTEAKPAESATEESIASGVTGYSEMAGTSRKWQANESNEEDVSTIYTAYSEKSDASLLDDGNVITQSPPSHQDSSGFRSSSCNDKDDVTMAGSSAEQSPLFITPKSNLGSQESLGLSMLSRSSYQGNRSDTESSFESPPPQKRRNRNTPARPGRRKLPAKKNA